MLWIRYLEEYKQGKETYDLEAELASEAKIVGLLDYENESIIISPLTHEKDKDNLYKYFLRIKAPREIDFQNQITTADKKGYLFNDGSLGEIISLLSLKLQARFFILKTASRKADAYDIPFGQYYSNDYSNRNISKSSDLIKDSQRNFDTDFKPFLDKIRAIDPEKHLDIAIASQHYLKGIQIVGKDPELFYIRLVSAIERAANKTKHPSHEFNSKVIEILTDSKKLTKDESNDIKNILNNSRPKLKFTEFIKKNCTKFFENEPREPKHLQISSNDLEIILKRIHEARSQYLHSGEPIHISMQLIDQPNMHILRGDRTIQNRLIPEDKILPIPSFFYRLVRHCLLNWIDNLDPQPLHSQRKKSEI